MTVLYCTSNREQAAFEERIMSALRDSSAGLPIVSVSQVPVDLGENVCVGDVGVSSHNYWRQLQIAAERARTPFVCTAQADFLYPPEYFSLRPSVPAAFLFAVPVHLIFTPRRMGHSYVLRRHGSEGAMLVGRDYLLAYLGRMFGELPQWRSGVTDLDNYMPSPPGAWRRETVTLSPPAVSFKTAAGMHLRNQRSPTKTAELPYWGRSQDLIRQYAGHV